MPPFILILLLLITSTLLVQVFVISPLEFLRNLSIPNWLTWATLAIVLFWCFGE